MSKNHPVKPAASPTKPQILLGIIGAGSNPASHEKIFTCTVLLDGKDIFTARTPLSLAILEKIIQAYAKALAQLLLPTMKTAGCFDYAIKNGMISEIVTGQAPEYCLACEHLIVFNERFRSFLKSAQS